MEFHYRQMHTSICPLFCWWMVMLFLIFQCYKIGSEHSWTFFLDMSKFLYDINLGITFWVMDFCALHFTKCCHFLSKSANIFIISNENSYFSTTCQPLVLLSFQWKKLMGMKMFCCLLHISPITLLILNSIYIMIGHSRNCLTHIIAYFFY